ncbi:MAG: hypothetical protein AAGJ34_09090 [Pseudomonadota bacterium]
MTVCASVLLSLSVGFPSIATDYLILSDIKIPTSYQVKKTCVYFNNLAFQDRMEVNLNSPYVTISEGCAAAQDLRNLAPTGSTEMKDAEAYLTRLVDFRNELLAMGSARFWAARGSSTNGQFIGRLSKMTKSSFYLVAKDHGIFEHQARIERAHRSTFYPIFNGSSDVSLQ